jgi:hypothetical protein
MAVFFRPLQLIGAIRAGVMCLKKALQGMAAMSWFISQRTKRQDCSAVCADWQFP